MKLVNTDPAKLYPLAQKNLALLVREAKRLEDEARFAPFEIEIEWAPGWNVAIRQRGEAGFTPLCKGAVADYALAAIDGARRMCVMLSATEGC